MILAYVFPFVHLPTWAWITTAAGAFGGLLLGMERMFNVLKAYREAREAKREAGVQRMLRQIEAMDEDAKRRAGSTVLLTPVEPGPGEDPEMVAEAWRRFVEKRRDREPR